MRITPIPMEGVLLLDPEVFRDERGFFMEVWRDGALAVAGLDATFVQGYWFGARPTAAGRRMPWAPPGMAHGFLTLSKSADVAYKCTDFHVPDDDRQSPGTTRIWPSPGRRGRGNTRYSRSGTRRSGPSATPGSPE